MNKTMNDYQPDTLMKDFWRKTANFDDVCNGLLFEGHALISDAVELDSEQGTTTENGSIQRRRDLIKMANVHGKDVIIGIENQQRKDKTMPFRDMEYTSLKYGIRLNDSKNEICPIITLVIYYGCTKWNKETELKKMMDIPEEIEKYFNNWKTIVIDAKEVDYRVFQSKEVKDFFEGLQNLYSWDKDITSLKGLQLTYDTALALGVVTGTEALIDKAEKERGGMINMCQAVDEALQEREAYGRNIGFQEGEVRGRSIGFQEGEIQGRSIGLQEGKIEAVIQHLQKIMKRFDVDLEEAMDILDIPVNERDTYRVNHYS